MNSNICTLCGKKLEGKYFLGLISFEIICEDCVARRVQEHREKEAHA